jgi:hypothetical protein
MCMYKFAVQMLTRFPASQCKAQISKLKLVNCARTPASSADSRTRVDKSCSSPLSSADSHVEVDKSRPGVQSRCTRISGADSQTYVPKERTTQPPIGRPTRDSQSEIQPIPRINSARRLLKTPRHLLCNAARSPNQN